jgi:tetratricopeptide (TPR) repeat protein
MYARALDLELQGKPDEARQLFRLAAEQEPELFWLRYEIALCTRNLREWDEAEAMFEALYTEAESGAEPRALLATLNSHGVMQLNRNRYDEAGDLFRRSLAVADQHGLAADRPKVLGNLALVASRRGDLESAAVYYDEALAASEAAEIETAPTFLNNYAGLLLRLGDLDRARAFAERAVEGFRVMGHRRYEAPSLNRLARILRRQGDLDGALERHEEAVAIYRDLGDVVGELSAMGAMSTVYRRRGDLTRAELNARDVLSRAADAGDEILLGDALMQLALVHLDLRRPDDALTGFEAAHELFARLGDAQGLRGAEDGMVRAALAMHDLDRASAVAERVMAAASEKGQPRTLADARLLTGLVAQAMGQYDRAAAAFAAALEYARDSGNSSLLQDAAAGLADVELSRGDVAAAAELVEEIREHAATRRDFQRLDARTALAQGDSERAESILVSLRNRAGEAWTDDDEALLASLDP